MQNISMEEFRRLVAEAMDQLPGGFRRRVDNLEVLVEELPEKSQQQRFGGLLLGLYQGVPLNRRRHAGMQLPDRITLYRSNILRLCRTRQQVREQVKKTLMHEIGHHFGMNEKEIRQAGY